MKSFVVLLKGKGAKKNRKKSDLLPNLYFGVLKRVKHGQKRLKNVKNTHFIFYIFVKKTKAGGGGFGKRPDFFSAPFPKLEAENTHTRELQIVEEL